MQSASIRISITPCISCAGCGEKNVSALPRSTKASTAAKTASCIAMPPRRLLAASSAAPDQAAVTVVATSGKLVATPSSNAPANACPTPVRSAIRSV